MAEAGPRPALAFNSTPALFATQVDLIARGEVAALQWSFDAGPGELPPAIHDLLDEYSRAGVLSAHGVHGSLFSVEWDARHREWLDAAVARCRRHPVRRCSEHLGFMRVPGYRQGAPLPIPFDEVALDLGRERLALLRDSLGVPVGLENLALAFDAVQVWRQGPFLTRLLEAVDGFLLLDLHNLFCQAVNFACPAEDLLATYPLHRVREIHVSGGSWSRSRRDPRGRSFRRDTHDGQVPERCWELLDAVLPRCPHLEMVILEHVGDGFVREDFLADWRRLVAVLAAEPAGV